MLALELLALVTASEGDAAEAAVLQGAASRIWPSVGLPLFGSAHYNAPHELCAAAARERLGEERYERCLARGAAAGPGGGRGAGVAPYRSSAGAGGDAVAAGRAGAGRGGGGRGKREPAASPTRKGGETAG
ncbi:hypothetical protein GCM10020256_64830 [Streptomyces thermocoprophilus]